MGSTLKYNSFKEFYYIPETKEIPKPTVERRQLSPPQKLTGDPKTHRGGERRLPPHPKPQGERDISLVAMIGRDGITIAGRETIES